MKRGQASWTAEITAIYRAVEALRPVRTRLVYDPCARLFLRRPFQRLLRIPPLARMALWLAVECRFPGGYDTIVARVRCVDDALRRALECGVQQIVILGAGYDARAYRFREVIQGVTVFEVDHPLTQRAKKEKAAGVFGRLPDHVVYVPIDFESESLEYVMPGHGYCADRHTFFIWEGVTKYLTAEGVETVLRWIAAHSAKGSRVIFDYLVKAMVEGRWPAPAVQRGLKYQQQKGELFLFGIEPAELAGWLKGLGFGSVERFSAADLKRRYLQPLNRGQRLHDFIEIAEGVV
jgi:methyltransferase (TIGR00027 family)